MPAECPLYEPMPKRKRGELRFDDYVLATKYHDGDPCDQFAIGWFVRVNEAGRYLVCDNDGKLFRASGFRRCARISERVGKLLVKIAPIISDKPGYSLWHWRRHIKAMEALC